MKTVVFYIRPNRYFETREALNQEGFCAFYSENVLGRGKKEVAYQISEDGTPVSSSPDDAGLVAKKEISITVRDQDVERLISVILRENSTGSSGDGKIFVLPTDRVERIRTGEKDDNALV